MSVKGTGILREMNQKKVLAFLRKHKISSRLEISRALKLSKNTVSLIIDDFMDKGIVRERGIKSEGVGRPRRILSLVEDAYKSVGILAKNGRIEFAITDYLANVIEQGEVSTAAENADEYVEDIIRLCRKLIDQYEGVLGIGVAVPGLVNSQQGIVYHSTKLKWENVDIGDTIRRELNVKVHIFNNVKVASLGAMDESLTDYSSVFYIRIGEGVGGALIINGNIFYGGSWTAGEIGHISVKSDGPFCNCGQRGCLEKLINIPALIEDLRLDAAVFFEAHHLNNTINRLKGVPEAHEIMRRYGFYLGSALAQVIHLINPQMILVDSIYQPFDEFTHHALETVKQKTLPSAFRETVIKFVNRMLSPAVGAAISVIMIHEGD